MRKINKIIVHCSYTPPNRDIGVKEIREWHVKENGWSDVGYHYIIRRNGSIEGGRKVEVAGAHTLGHNYDSIGICLVGGMPEKEGRPLFNYTAAQIDSLGNIITHIKKEFPSAKVRGHNDYTTKKTCPNFDVSAWWSSEGAEEPFDNF